MITCGFVGFAKPKNARDRWHVTAVDGPHE
jgi:hypothetical protein